MKKHSREEITSKLARAGELASGGKSQVDVCKTLGVSVMTLYRWRKLHLAHDVLQDDGVTVTSSSANLKEIRAVLEELKLENQRLRKILTDLLLEKTMLEEARVASSRRSRTGGPTQPSRGPSSR